MARQIQIRRGTATEHNEFTGAIGEITMDTSTNTLRVHDGRTVGGIKLAKQQDLDSADYVIESQLPTAENNYTWYRKYKSGWLEQGGTISLALEGRVTSLPKVTFPKPMKDTRYHISTATTFAPSVSNVSFNINTSKLSTGFSALGNIAKVDGGATGGNAQIWWTVKGIGA